MSSLGRRRAASTAIPLVLMAVVIGLLALVQFRWLTELGRASRLQMERSLRGAVQTSAVEVTLEVGRLFSSIDDARNDPRAVELAWRERRQSAPAVAGLFRLALEPGGEGPIRLMLDSAFMRDSLLPALALRVAAVAQLGVAVALIHRDSGGAKRVVARVGPVLNGSPDAVAPIGLTWGRQRAVFLSEGPAQTPNTGRAPGPGIAWSVAPDGGDLDQGSESAEWSLYAWHESGSLERAAFQIRRRNLIVGFGLIAVLVGSAALTLAGFRRSAQLAADQAIILAGISHEVRTPLAVIRSAADNLSAGIVSATDQVREYGRLIERETARLEDNLEGALAFARVAAPGQVGAETINLRELAVEIRDASECPSRIEIDGEPVFCRGDRRALATAVRNLVANALAYSTTDRLVTLSTRQDGSVAELTVRDRGPGVPVSERSRVFDPFYRGGVGLASGRSGLGLGLALAERVATLHRGRIQCEAPAGGGAMFRLRVPAA